MRDKKARFVPFWILLGILGILLIGSFITPFKITLDNIFERIESDSVDNGTPLLSCNNTDSPNWMKGTCFTLRGFMVIFILYLLYNWINGMYNGGKSQEPIFSKKYKALQQALEQ